MKFFVKALILLLFVACAQNKPLSNSKEWVLKSTDPEISLTIDDQFLQKSRQVDRRDSQGPLAKKAFLHP